MTSSSMTAGWWVGGLLIGVLVASCGSSDEPEPEATASVAAAIATVPSGAFCIQLVVSGSQTIDRGFDVTPGARSILTLEGLQPGDIYVQALAYDWSCASALAGALATWESDPVGTTLVRGRTADVTLVMRPRTGTNAMFTVDFPEGSGEFVSRLAAGDVHTCATRRDGTLWCAGGNSFGQLGQADIVESTSAIPLRVGSLVGVVQVAASGSGNVYSPGAHTCVLTFDRKITCFGLNDAGQAGAPPSTLRLPPTQISGIADAVSIAVSESCSFAVQRDGTVACWGMCPGNTTYESNRLYEPVAIPELSGVKAVAMGRSHTCALKIDGTVACWGTSDFGQLGNNSQADAETPVAVFNLSGVRSIVAGVFHSCALKSDQTVWCWGLDVDSGPSGTSTDYRVRYVPTQVPTDSGVIALAAGPYTTCVAYNDGRVACDLRIPQVKTIPNVAAIALSHSHRCAATRGGGVHCWGRNNEGQLGLGTTSSDAVAEPTLTQF
ncbi:MAG: hypothetical protein HY698_06895 [Deltaproteobacteria bacterium]|nr:hypothetical protein [Deltaproteobacteria bacterium]